MSTWECYLLRLEDKRALCVWLCVCGPSHDCQPVMRDILLFVVKSVPTYDYRSNLGCERTISFLDPLQFFPFSLKSEHTNGQVLETIPCGKVP